MRDLKSQRDSIMWKLFQFCSIITIQIFSGFDLTTSSYKNHGDGDFSWLGSMRPDSDNKPDMEGCFEKWPVENTVLKRWVNETADVTCQEYWRVDMWARDGSLTYYEILQPPLLHIRVLLCCLPWYPQYPPPYMAARKARIVLWYLRSYSGIWHRSSSDIFVKWIKND